MLVVPQQQQKLSSSEIFKALGDAETQRMLMEIATKKQDWHENCMGMTRRAFYKRLRVLKTCSLIHKINGAYRLTALGTMIHYELRLVNNIILNAFSFAIIDLLEKDTQLSREHKRELLPKLIDGSVLKRFEEAS